jgi:acyl-CoA thioester hydrolase
MRLAVDPTTDPGDYDFVHPIRVRFVETDAMGIVHHSNYLAYFEEARVAYLRHVGHPYQELRDEGMDSAVLECWVQYRQPLRFDDVVDLHLVLASATRATFQMNYLLTVAGEVRAVGSTVHGTITSDARPTRLPDWLREMARPVTRVTRR